MTVKLSAGSVFVEATIAPPQSVSMTVLKSRLALSKESLAERIVEAITATQPQLGI